MYDMTSKEFTPILDNNNVLLCPNCECYNLHQFQVLSAFRDSEDKDGTIVKINRKVIIKERVLSKNIPFRRDMAVVYFDCENCDTISSLNIVQHKGCTYLNLLPLI